jgi:hypothetical protein
MVQGMESWTFDTPRGPATLRSAALSDVEAKIALNKLCFPLMVEENVVRNRAQLRNHLRVYPDGQLLVEIGGLVVCGAA